MAFERLPIDIALVSRLVSAQFPQWAGLPIRTVEPGGNDNRTFRLGADLLVRLPSHPIYAAAVEKEQAWLPRLAAGLPLPIPTPIGLGAPAEDYPCRWSVYRWLPGRPLSLSPVEDLVALAVDLGDFLAAFQHLDATGGPPAGPESFHRGGDLAAYDVATQEAISLLDGQIDVAAARAVWTKALASRWTRPPVWVHGDVAVGNLLADHGRLSAVIDFGSFAVGDPACDLVVAWTLFSGESRAAFRAHVALHAETWERARGWALWKALITLARPSVVNPPGAPPPRKVLDAVLAEAKSA